MSSRQNNFIERSILGALSFLKESLFSEDEALNRGFLQSVDPRFKIISFVLFLTAAIFMKNVQPLLWLYLICLLLAVLSKIQIGFFLKRTLVFIPVFSLFIALPAIFSVISPGEALFTLNFLGIKLFITRQGLSGAVIFLARVTAMVSFIVLLSLVTRHTELLRMLRIFKIPQVFVMTLGMCYRYIFLFVEIIENTYLAIKSRVGARVSYARGQKVVAWNIGNLWQRSSLLNEQVYSAMLSRGYTGEPRVLEEFKAGLRDWAWLISALLISVFSLYLDKWTT